jgi:hypothetical protein
VPPETTSRSTGRRPSQAFRLRDVTELPRPTADV